jgi:hypothetical protein
LPQGKTAERHCRNREPGWVFRRLQDSLKTVIRHGG